LYIQKIILSLLLALSTLGCPTRITQAIFINKEQTTLTGQNTARADRHVNLKESIEGKIKQIEQIELQLAQGDLPQDYAAQIEVRLRNLEQLLQSLTGQLEQIQHKQSQFDSRLDRALNDIEFRLDNLEKSRTQTSFDKQRSHAGVQSETETSTHSTGSRSPTMPIPVPNTNTSEENIQDYYQLPKEVILQYNRAYELLQSADYNGAEQILRTFLAQYSDHPLASNAWYWLGESYYIRSRYGEAVSTFAQGYQRFPNGAKTADTLLKLGMALTKIGQHDKACLTFSELIRSSYNAPAAIQQRARQERASLKCKK
jgi:tol-pal system protein YbgF